MSVGTGEAVDLKFRLFDGSDIGPEKFGPATTVVALKETILRLWPTDKGVLPKSINDVKLINAGKVLENGKTLSESRVMMGEIPGGVITMLVVLRPSSEAKAASSGGEDGKQGGCGCIIL